MGERRPQWLVVRIDGHEHVIRVIARDTDEAADHLRSALDHGQRIEHTTRGGTLVVEWSRVATLQIIGPAAS